MSDYDCPVCGGPARFDGAGALAFFCIDAQEWLTFKALAIRERRVSIVP